MRLSELGYTRLPWLAYGASDGRLKQMAEHDLRNAASRERLADLLRSAKTKDAHPANPTTSGILAHIAFWDRIVLLRWQQAFTAGQSVPPALDSSMIDLINDAAFPQWRQIRLEDAINDALRIAAELDRLIQGLDPIVVQELVRAGRERLIDRSLHRNEHFDELERNVRQSG
jgi:hypothetical protein